jgi:hypothetical protein
MAGLAHTICAVSIQNLESQNATESSGEVTQSSSPHPKINRPNLSMIQNSGSRNETPNSAESGEKFLTIDTLTHSSAYPTRTDSNHLHRPVVQLGVRYSSSTQARLGLQSPTTQNVIHGPECTLFYRPRPRIRRVRFFKN